MNFLIQRSVGQQLAIGFGGLVLFLVISAGSGVGLVSYMEASLPNEQIIAKQRCAINFRGSVHDRAISLRDVTLVDSTSELRTAIDEIDSLTADYAQAAKALDALMAESEGGSATEQEILSRIEETERRTLPLIKRVVAARNAGDNAEAKGIMMAEARPLFVRWLAEINEFIDYAEDRNQDGTTTARANGAWLKGFLIVFALLAVTAGVLLAVFITRGVVRQVAQVRDVLQGIAGGDLTQAAINSTARGELGDLARATDQMALTLRQLLAEVDDAAEAVANGVEGIREASEKLSSGADSQAKRLEGISNAVKAMTRSLGEVTDRTQTANEAADRSGELASVGGAAVTESINDMKQIEAIVARAATSVNGLGQRSEQIGGIVGVINEIADQTNLLALNAAIEAARAGEHGRGFAVVADEVRKLADRTTSATDEIARSIEIVRSEIGVATEEIDSGTRKVVASVTRAGEAHENLELILNSAKNVASQVRSISASTKEQDASANEMVEAIASIHEIGKGTADSSSQSAKASRELVAQTRKLRETLARFQR